MPGGRSFLTDTSNLDRTNEIYKIRPADYIQWTTGAKDYGFNWLRYTYLINKSTDAPGKRSENVADYVRADKHSTATTWGRITENNIFHGMGAMVGEEINARVMSSVPDSQAGDNGLRFVWDIGVSASDRVLDYSREVGWTAVGRVGSTNPKAYFSNGWLIGAIRETGIQLKSWIGGGVRAFEALGKWNVAFDASGADVSSGSALRMAAGQSIHLEASCQRGLRYTPWTPDGKGDRLQYVVNGTPVFEITSDGHLMRGGVQIL